MASTLGINDLKNISIPSAWDMAELGRLQLRDGTTYETLLNDIDAALALVNGSVLNTYAGNLLSITDQPEVEYRTGVSNGFEDHTEYTNPDPKRAETSGHMLPIAKKDRALGWTADFLEEARRVQIDADIASMVEDAYNAFEKAVYTRLFKLEEETGKRYGLGTGGVSVPFADGGNGTIDYVPVPNPERMINAFSTSHTHFLRLNGITQANLETAIGHMWEHGVDGPYELIVSLADLGSWQNTTNVTGFVKNSNAFITYGNTTALATVDANIYQGVVETKYGPARLYANGRIPTTYWAVTKTYGANDQRNPLRVRYDPMSGFGVKLVSQFVSKYPLYGAIGQMKFGVGIGENRLGAVAVLNASSGSYSTPTIS